MVNRAFLSAVMVVIPIAAAAAQSPRSAPASTDVPVTKVVLFSSGVGYFEHVGTVHGSGSTELRFKTGQINDVLKSIVLQDQDGGRVGTITYPSQDPLTKTLRSFQVDITQNPGLGQLLNQLRGARVSVQAQAERITGTVLGVESRRKAADKGDPVDVSVLNLLTGAAIRSVELPAISGLSLEDPQLQDELAKALAALVQARDQDKKPVTISFSGTGDRRVRVGYVVETPVWKTSYRLLLDDAHNIGRLQGWAIVENQTESDWNDVSLSLVSGHPISFVMDLYQPLYATRPTVVPALFAGLRPQLYESGLAGRADTVPMSRRAEAPRAPPARRVGYNPDGTPNVMALNEVVITSAIDAGASVRGMAATSDMGALFEYHVGNVVLPRQKSAMLPIITDSIGIERVSIYNASVLSTHPLNGVRLKNSTGKHLLQGPVTVLDRGTYAGDARIDDVPRGQERLLSYGIDLDVAVDNTRHTASDLVVNATIDNGMLTIRRKLVTARTYAFDNKSATDRPVIIEHPIAAGARLVDTPPPVETTPSVYRFRGTAIAGKVTTLTVKEETTLDDAIALLPADIVQITQISRGGDIPKVVRDALARAVELKQAMIDVDREIAARTQALADISAEQSRIRENMKTVAPSVQYYERLLAKLNEQESSIESLQKAREALVARRESSRRALEEYVGSLRL